MQDFRKTQEPAVNKLKEPVIDKITTALKERYKLNFTRQDTSSLWFLCKQVNTIHTCAFYFLIEELLHLMSLLISLSPLIWTFSIFLLYNKILKYGRKHRC